MKALVDHDPGMVAWQNDILNGTQKWVKYPPIYDAWKICEFAAICKAHDLDADYEEIQRILCRKTTGWEAYVYASKIPGANISMLQQAIIDKGTAGDMLRFAQNIKGADIPRLHAAAKKNKFEYLTMEKRVDFNVLYKKSQQHSSGSRMGM